MSVKAEIKDGAGSNRTAKITFDQALCTTQIKPDLLKTDVAVLTRRKLFSAFFENSGSRDLNVDGSVTPVKFVIESELNIVKVVKQIRVFLHDGNLDLNTSGNLRRFGSAATTPGLTNGVELFISQEGADTQIFLDPVQNIADFLHYSDRELSFSKGIDVNTDLLLLTFNLLEDVIIPPGLLDRITMTVNDDLTAVDLFQVLAVGTREEVIT